MVRQSIFLGVGKDMDDALPNYIAISGKAYADTDMIAMKVGKTIKGCFIGTNDTLFHPMHVHGRPFTLVAHDGIAMASFNVATKGSDGLMRIFDVS